MLTKVFFLYLNVYIILNKRVLVSNDDFSYCLESMKKFISKTNENEKYNNIKEIDHDYEKDLKRKYNIMIKEKNIVNNNDDFYTNFNTSNVEYKLNLDEKKFEIRYKNDIVY